MTWMGKGDQGCNGNTIAESDLTGNDSGRYLWIIRRRIGGSARSAIDDRCSRVLQHCRHLRLKGLHLGLRSWQADPDESASQLSQSSQRKR